MNTQTEELQKSLLEICNQIFREEVEIDLHRDQFPKWDSLRHVELIVAVQKKFNIKLSANEMINIRQLVDLLKILESKI